MTMLDDDLARILAAEERRRAALVSVDLAELAALFSDDLTHVHSTGLVHDKAALLAHIKERRAFVAVERGMLDVRVYGDIAVMAGPMTNHMRVDGREVVLTGFVTQVLRREGADWRFVNFQLTLKTG